MTACPPGCWQEVERKKEECKEITKKPVGGNVDFADNIEKKRLFNARVLRAK
jgi:hypothetical protein